MAATPTPATPRLMALKRFIGGAVRGLGMKLLDRAVRSIAMADSSIADGVAAVAMPSMIAFWQRLIMVEAALEAGAEHGASDARQPAYVRALLSGRVLYLSECVDSSEDDCGSVMASARTSRIYISFNCSRLSPGMIPQWRNTLRLTPKIFKSRICALGRIAP